MLILNRSQPSWVVLLVASFASLFARDGAAQVTYPARPAEGQFVADLAGMISDEDEAAIKKTAGGVLQSKGVPIIVVTINSMAQYGASGWPIERYAMNLFGEWAIGSAERNLGVLLLVSKNDRKVRVEMGGGYTHERDVAMAGVVNRTIVPRFKAGDFSGGIRAGVEAISQNLGTAPGGFTPGGMGSTSRAGGAADSSAATSRGIEPPPANPAGTVLGGRGLFSALGCFIIPIGLIVLFMIIKAFTGRSGRTDPYGPGYGPSGWGGGWGTRPSSGMGGMLGGLLLGGLLGNAWGSRHSSHHDYSGGSSGGGFGGFGSGGGGFGGGGFGGGGGGSFGGGFSGGGGATGSW